MEKYGFKNAMLPKKTTTNTGIATNHNNMNKYLESILLILSASKILNNSNLKDGLSV